MLSMYINYRLKVEKKANAAPKRIIFYRGTLAQNTYDILESDRQLDGVSEGQFKQARALHTKAARY